MSHGAYLLLTDLINIPHTHETRQHSRLLANEFTSKTFLSTNILNSIYLTPKVCLNQANSNFVKNKQRVSVNYCD